MVKQYLIYLNLHHKKGKGLFNLSYFVFFQVDLLNSRSTKAGYGSISLKSYIINVTLFDNYVELRNSTLVGFNSFIRTGHCTEEKTKNGVHLINLHLGKVLSILSFGSMKIGHADGESSGAIKLGANSVKVGGT